MTRLHICRSVRGFLFDLDGTLIDSCHIIISSLQKSLRAVAGMQVSREALADLSGQPLDETLRLLGVSDQQRVADHYRCNYPFGLRSTIFPGVPGVLHELTRRGYRMALVTTRPDDEAAAELAEHGIADYFPHRITAGHVRRRKPHPEPVARGTHMLSLEPAEVIMVGDSGVDIEAGRRAGTWTGLAGWGGAGGRAADGEYPDFVWHSPGEIIAALDEPLRDSPSGEGDRGE